MRRRDGDLARPLLDISRREIEPYLARLHLTPRRDPSNEDARFTRNRLRQQVLPAIDGFDPAARELLARTADILSEEDRFLNDAIAGLPDDLARDRIAFAKLPPALQRRVIRRLVPDAGFLEVEALHRPRVFSSRPAPVIRPPSGPVTRSVTSMPTSSSCRWSSPPAGRATACGRWGSSRPNGSRTSSSTPTFRDISVTPYRWFPTAEKSSGSPVLRSPRASASPPRHAASCTSK
jgi:hypothetical protein